MARSDDPHATPDRAAKLRAALLEAIPRPPDEWPVGVPFVVDVRVQELASGEFVVTATSKSAS